MGLAVCMGLARMDVQLLQLLCLTSMACIDTEAEKASSSVCKKRKEHMSN